MTDAEQPADAASVGAPGGLLLAVAGGDRRAMLTATRDLLARALDDPETSARDVAALTARFTDVLEAIAALPTGTEGTALDELTKRRESRTGPTARPARARRG